MAVCQIANPESLIEIDLGCPGQPRSSDDQVVLAGIAAWSRLKQCKTWRDWLVVGEALLVGRTEAMRSAHTNVPEGSRYNREFGDWLVRTPLGKLIRALASACSTAWRVAPTSRLGGQRCRFRSGLTLITRTRSCAAGKRLRSRATGQEAVIRREAQRRVDPIAGGNRAAQARCRTERCGRSVDAGKFRRSGGGGDRRHIQGVEGAGDRAGDQSAAQEGREGLSHAPWSGHAET
jgi:hypothetical protein